MDDMTKQAWSTSSCIVVLCYPEIDGLTRIVLGKRSEVDPGRISDFSTVLRTPKHVLMVTEVGDRVIFSMPVPGEITLVRIWFSHPKWPEQVIIGLE